MPKPFRIQKGMFLIITKVLPYETPAVVGYGYTYDKVWQYWLDNPDKDWDLAMVKTDMTSRGEIHTIFVITKPIPPRRYRARLRRRMWGL